MKKIIVLLIVISFFIACQTNKDDTIKIGVSLPLTGDAALWGKSQKDGYELALKQINDNGGINVKKVELIYGDDKGIAKDGISVLQKFIEIDKISILTGVANSSVALAYIPIIEKNKILFMSSGASSPKLTGSSKYFFRTWPSDIAEGMAMAKYAKEELELSNIAVLYINNDYGVGLLEPFTESFKKLGGTITTTQSFEQKATDFKTQLTIIKNTKSEAIYLAGNPIEMARAIKQAREIGIQTTFLSISTLNEPEVLKITRGDALEGTIITDASFDPNSTNPNTQKFMNDFQKMFNKKPGILANTAYDALMVLAYAIENVGENPDSLQVFLHKMKNFDGVSGKINFTYGGDVNRNIRIVKFKNNLTEIINESYMWY